MALAFRAGSFVSAGNASGAAISINKPTGTADGDIMVTAIYFEPDTTSITAPAGWTQAFSLANTGAFLLEIWWKVAASEGTTYSWNNTTGGNQWRSVVSGAYSGATGSGEREDLSNGSQADAVLITSQTAPSITTTGTNRMLIFGYGNFGGEEVTATTGAASNFRGSLGGTIIADALIAAAGATGTSRPSSGPGSQDYVGIHTALISDIASAGSIPPGLIRPVWRTITRRVYR